MTKIDGLSFNAKTNMAPPATQKTESISLRQAISLRWCFFGFELKPSLIVVLNLASRETSMAHDSVEITLDTFTINARLHLPRDANGYAMGCTLDEGFSNRAGFDTPWGLCGIAKASATDQRFIWSHAVPIASLRFPAMTSNYGECRLGVRIHALSEESFWPPYSIEVTGLCTRTALLSAIRNVSPGNNTQISRRLFFARHVLTP